MKKYILLGNNLKMEMVLNDNQLKIVGNNNYIKIHRNHGSVMMVGNECSIDVFENFGNVEVTGGSSTVKISACNSVNIIDYSEELVEINNINETVTMKKGSESEKTERRSKLIEKLKHVFSDKKGYFCFL